MELYIENLSESKTIWYILEKIKLDMVAPCFRGGGGESGVWKGHQKDEQIWGGNHHFHAHSLHLIIIFIYMNVYICLKWDRDICRVYAIISSQMPLWQNNNLINDQDFNYLF